MAVIEAGRLPGVPCAVVTTFGGLIVKRPDGVTDVEASRALARPIVDAGLVCITEVYARTDDGRPTGRTAASMEQIAREQLGFQRVQDAYGVFGGARLDDYPLREGYAVWLAEYVL